MPGVCIVMLRSEAVHEITVSLELDPKHILRSLSGMMKNLGGRSFALISILVSGVIAIVRSISLDNALLDIVIDPLMILQNRLCQKPNFEPFFFNQPDSISI